MGRTLLIAILAALGLAAPAGSGAPPPEQPDGRLVLGVARLDPRMGAYTRGWAVVADPRTGFARRRRIPLGDLCYGPVISANGRIGRFDPRAQRRLLRSAGAPVRARLGGRRELAWSPSHRWLYFTESNRRLLAWRAGSDRVVELPVRPRGEILSLAVLR
jgi:hypothetical protein